MLGEPPFPTASRSGCCPLGAETEPRLRRGGHVLLLKTPVGKSSGEMGRRKESTVLSGAPLHNSDLATNHTAGSRPAAVGVGGKDEAWPFRCISGAEL